MISWEEDRECLETYYDAYKDWLDFLNIDMSYDEFKEYSKPFDIYRVSLGDEYIGCMMFEPRHSGMVFHMAVLPEFRGRWTHYWKDIKQWMLDKYRVIYGATHVLDTYNSKVLSRAGFRQTEELNNFNWWIFMGIGAAIAGVGGSIIGGALSSKGSKDAAKTSAAASDRASQIQLQMFREGQEATAPWRQTGEGALGALENIYGTSQFTAGEDGMPIEGADAYQNFFSMQDRLREGFKESPGQAYQLGEAEKASKRALNARGFSDSGAEFKELQRISQGQAAQDYGNYLNQFGDYTNSLRSLSGQGQTSAGQTAGQSAQVGSSVGSNIQSAGAAAAQNEIAQANIYGNVLAQGAQAYGMYQGMQPQTQYQPAPQAAGAPYGLSQGYSYA